METFSARNLSESTALGAWRASTLARPGLMCSRLCLSISRLTSMATTTGTSTPLPSSSYTLKKIVSYSTSPESRSRSGRMVMERSLPIHIRPESSDSARTWLRCADEHPCLWVAISNSAQNRSFKGFFGGLKYRVRGQAALLAAVAAFEQAVLGADAPRLARGATGAAHKADGIRLGEEVRFAGGFGGKAALEGAQGGRGSCRGLWPAPKFMPEFCKAMRQALTLRLGQSAGFVRRCANYALRLAGVSETVYKTIFENPVGGGGGMAG